MLGDMAVITQTRLQKKKKKADYFRIVVCILKANNMLSQRINFEQR
jgi:hypothetical protein